MDISMDVYILIHSANSAIVSNTRHHSPSELKSCSLGTKDNVLQLHQAFYKASVEMYCLSVVSVTLHSGGL